MKKKNLSEIPISKYDIDKIIVKPVKPVKLKPLKPIKPLNFNITNIKLITFTKDSEPVKDML